jgi:integron integrase
LIEAVKTEVRSRHYSYRTETTYLDWVRRFIAFHDYTNPTGLDAPTAVKTYLDYLAVEREVMSGITGWMAGLMYGSGLRLMECVRLRVKDIDFARNQIMVRDGKGQKDRVTMLPERFAAPLKEHLARVKAIYDQDLAQGTAGVYIWSALERKYPNAGKEWIWQYVFPAKTLSVDPRSSKVRRHHINETVVQKAVKEAAAQAAINKKVSCHTLRHFLRQAQDKLFATHLLQARYDIRTVQELLGHANVVTTMIYTHVLNRPGLSVKSPADI